MKKPHTTSPKGRLKFAYDFTSLSLPFGEVGWGFVFTFPSPARRSHT